MDRTTEAEQMRRSYSKSRHFRRMLHRVSPGILAVFVGIASLAGGQWVVTQRATADLRAYAASLLKQSEAVASASVDGLRKVASLKLTPCSEKDLSELRYIAFHSRYIKDVGRLKAGRVTCTALWGRLTDPAPMAASQRTVHGYSLWSEVSAPGDSRIRVNISSYENAVVITAPRAFEEISSSMEHIGALVVTRDAKHVFQSFGQSSQVRLKVDGTSPSGGEYLVSKACSKSYDICAIAQRLNPSLTGQPAVTLVSISLLALVAGLGAGALLKLSQHRERALDRMLVRAIRHGDIDLVYQPLRKLSDLRLVGVEALARWKAHSGISVPPDIFIPMAERLGMGTQLAKLVISRCFGEIGSQLALEEGVYVSINLSAQDILDKSLRQYVSCQADLHGIASEKVVLELTERASASQKELMTALSDLRARGFRVYLDDFGTGYSNFAYLDELPLAGLKMDRRFTRAVGTKSPASQAVEAICAMAGALNLPLVAEGVETEEQLIALRALIPTAIGQGWYLGRPSASKDILWEGR